MNEPFLYRVTYQGKIVYRAYRLEKAMYYFEHEKKADKLYIYTKNLFPAVALLRWK